MLWGLRGKKKQQQKNKPDFSQVPRDKEMQEVENHLLFYVILFQPELCQRAKRNNSALIIGNVELDSFLSSIKFHRVYNDINLELSR